MDIFYLIDSFLEGILFAACLFLLIGGIYLTWKTRFIQFRIFSALRSQGKQEKQERGKHTLSASRALFTAMSTTLGISTIVGPVIAIRLGGPGALFGFLLASFFGGAMTYIEVTLSIHHRQKLEDGRVMGGPMPYIKQLLSAKMAKFYAVGCIVLLMGWSAAQANQLTAVLSSSNLGAYKIPAVYSSLLVVVLLFFALKGGVRRIGSFSARLVPLMFCLYIGSSLWIVFNNLGQMSHVFEEIFSTLWTPKALIDGSCIGGIVSALRWGIFKGVQVTEAGVGTQTIPHSLAETHTPARQGAIAMLSTFSAGGVAFLSGCVALLTDTWQDETLPLGMAMVFASYQQYFSLIGLGVVAVSAFLFGFGTILGNAFNGGQCFAYLMSSSKRKRYFLLAMMTMVFLGGIGEARIVWSAVDILLACIAIPHVISLLIGVRRLPELFIWKRNELQVEA